MVEADPDVRVAIITGAGRAFSAGFDINPDPGSPSPHDGSPDQWRSHLQELIDTFMKVWNLPKPVIAAVNGYALGGACELVQVCDVKIASERAVLGEPEIRAGFGPAAAHHPVQRQPRRRQGTAAHRRHRRRLRGRPHRPGKPGGSPRPTDGRSASASPARCA